MRACRSVCTLCVCVGVFERRVCVGRRACVGVFEGVGGCVCVCVLVCACRSVCTPCMCV